MQKSEEAELLIIGIGPAGLTASIYASRYGVKNTLIGSLSGGQISESHLIDNYPGIENINGKDLANKMLQHAKKYGAKVWTAEVVSAKKTPQGFQIKTDAGKTLKAKAIILATGTQRKKLAIPGEDTFYGKGVSYCATCDGFFHKNKEIAVIGGSDGAAGAAVYLAGIAKKVYLIYRKKELRCEQYWKNAINKAKNVEILVETKPLKIIGKDRVESLKINTSQAAEKELLVSGIFIEVGSDPKTKLAQKLKIETDEDGYIKIGKDGSTSTEGVWAAGDVTNGSDKFKQIATAVAEGAIAARSAQRYLKQRKINKTK